MWFKLFGAWPSSDILPVEYLLHSAQEAALKIRWVRDTGGSVHRIEWFDGELTRVLSRRQFELQFVLPSMRS